MLRMLLATRNNGKIAEMRDLLNNAAIELIDLDGAAISNCVEETGDTFAENARLKASAYATLSSMHSIADDSGLEVAALDGRPGVLSARYAGEKSSYQKKIQTLLSEIESSRSRDRSARFVSHIAISDPSGVVIYEAEGICSGVIADASSGANGFGYDPIFKPDGFNKTFGELDQDVKRRISHRSIAISKIIRFLRDLA